MLDLLKEMFSYPFMVRAILVGTIVALCSSLLGVSLVLKRYSMIGDGLSHVGFGALALATALNMAPLTISIPIVVLAAFLLLRINESSRIKGDAAIALISTGALAIGVMVISLTTGMNTDVCNYLFGSILSMSQSDVNLSVVLSVIVLVLFILFYNRIFSVTFDESFAKATGTNAGLYNTLIALLTALMIVLGMRMMGALLITSLIVFPALTSMRLCKKFKAVTPPDSNSPESSLNVESAAPETKALEEPSSSVPASRPPTLGSDSPNTPVTDTTGESAEGDVLEIGEKMFLTQISDMYCNFDHYKDKTIIVEGMYAQFYSWDGSETAPVVYRNGPGCCGNDGWGGFLLKYDGEFPNENDWIRVTGHPELVTEGYYTNLYLNVASLEVKAERGTEFVTQ